MFFKYYFLNSTKNLVQYQRLERIKFNKYLLILHIVNKTSYFIYTLYTRMTRIWGYVYFISFSWPIKYRLYIMMRFKCPQTVIFELKVSVVFITFQIIIVLNQWKCCQNSSRYIQTPVSLFFSIMQDKLQLVTEQKTNTN